ncbi:MAG: IPT/TIG domain-containing protein [Pyrinomonadaceae bacterium]
MKPLKFFIFFFLIVGGILISAQNTKAQTGYMISSLEVIDTTVFGYSETSLYDYNFGYYYEVGVEGRLFDQNNNQLAYGSNPRTNPSAQVDTRVYGAIRGQNYKLISRHTAYAQYYRYTEEQRFVYNDQYGISGYGPGDYSSPYEIQTSYSRELVTDIIELGRTSVTLQVPLVAPQLTSIDVDNGVPGGNPIQTLLRGSNLFGNNRYVIVNGGGGVNITLQPLTNNTNLVDVNIQIDANAPLGDRQISLSVDGQTSNSLTFRVGGDRSPVITNISPSEAAAGESVTVTITGMNFGVNPRVEIDGFGVSRNILSSSSTEIRAVFTVSDSADEGSRNVRVISLGATGTGFAPGAPGDSDTSNGVGFYVRPIAVFFQFFQIVGKDSSRNVAVTILPGNVPVTLTLVRANSSSGDARFENNSYTMQLNRSGTVKIYGITESSVRDDISLTANAGNAPSQPFSVALVKINRDNPQDGTNSPKPITDMTTTTIVGERIKLSSQIVPSGLVPSEQFWIIPPKAVEDFFVSPDQQTGKVIEVSDRSPQVSFAWVDGGGATVNDYTTKQVDFAWRDNDYGILGKTTFRVTRPVTHVETATSKTTLETISSSEKRLVYADGSIDGIQFNSTASLERPAGYGGYTRWVQIVNRSKREVLFNSLVLFAEQQDGLDGCYPYAPLGVSSTEDSPFIKFNFPVFNPNDTFTVNADDAFTMWLMFQPSSPESIAVPLKKVDWVWNAQANYASRRWTFSGTSNPPTPNPVFVDTTDFPIWTKLVPDTEGRCPSLNP